MTYGSINPDHLSPFVYSKTVNNVTVTYKDEGWLNSGAIICNHPQTVKEVYHNGYYAMRGTDEIYICHLCHKYWHVDMSD